MSEVKADRHAADRGEGGTDRQRRFARRHRRVGGFSCPGLEDIERHGELFLSPARATTEERLAEEEGERGIENKNDN